ncbi:MAG: glycosyltransferase [Candidatus Daviesbacteria bacterium]|nr:glycosyltransferase [Candidatus Daviesbacteria bacterium]
MIDPKDVTIIIPHWGATPEQEYALDQCLTSLLETCECKIIVAKNGSATCPYNNPEDRVRGVVVEDQGQCKAVNAAVATVNTPWILVTNDDMIYAPGWFEKLVDFSWFGEKEKDILCVSPMLVEPIDGAPTFHKYFCGGAGGDFDKVKWLEFAKNWNVATPGKWRTGFNLPFLIKKELLDIISIYDINYDPWGSNGDSDLQAKIHLAGIQSYQNTNCIVYHFSQTSGTGHPDNRSYWEKNWHYFINKWGFERQSGSKVWQSIDIIDYEKLKYHPWWENWFKNR